MQATLITRQDLTVVYIKGDFHNFKIDMKGFPDIIKISSRADTTRLHFKQFSSTHEKSSASENDLMRVLLSTISCSSLSLEHRNETDQLATAKKLNVV